MYHLCISMSQSDKNNNKYHRIPFIFSKKEILQLPCLSTKNYHPILCFLFQKNSFTVDFTITLRSISHNNQIRISGNKTSFLCWEEEHSQLYLSDQESNNISLYCNMSFDLIMVIGKSHFFFYSTKMVFTSLNGSCQL